MAEQEFRKKVVRALRCFDAQSIENVVGVGTPDIATIVGWIETKWRPDFPKRASTPVSCDHFTPTQRAWHLRHARRGGISYVFWQISDEFFLIDGKVAAEEIGEATRERLGQIARLHLTGSLDTARLKASLKNIFHSHVCC